MTDKRTKEAKKESDDETMIRKGIDEFFYRCEFHGLDNRTVATALLEASMVRVHEIADSHEIANNVIEQMVIFVDVCVNPKSAHAKGNMIIPSSDDPSKIH